MNNHIRGAGLIVLIAIAVAFALVGVAALSAVVHGAEPPHASLAQLQRSYVNVIVGYKSAKHDKEVQFSAGSGSVLYSDGKQSLVLTCAHVVSFDGAAIVVYPEDETSGIVLPLVAKIERVDPSVDLALLRVEGNAGRPLALAPSEPPRWSRVLTMGNGGGFGAWGSEGFVASRQFAVHKQRYWRVVAPMMFGMSGGPVVDQSGRLTCVLSNMMQHAVALPGGGDIHTPATSFALCVPLESIRTFLTGVSL